MQDRSFRIASPSFFQVNTPQAETMVKLVHQGLALKGDEVLVDAYAGVGTFAALLAPSVQRVIAIEESTAATKDAQVNFAGLANLELRRGRVEDVLASLNPQPDTVILDPPRTGCHPRVLETLNRLAPRRVAYISCDPTALARDLQYLVKGPFRIQEVQPIDLFPQTHHVECIAILSRNGEGVS